MKPVCDGDVFRTGVVGTLASLEGFGVAAGGVVVGVVAGVVCGCTIAGLSKARAQTVV